MSVLGFSAAAAAVALALSLRSESPTIHDPAPHSFRSSPPIISVARIDPQGNVVLAGLAGQEQDIQLFDGETALTQAISDKHGDWVAVPNAPLSPGLHQILAVGADESVLVSIPGNGFPLFAIAHQQHRTSRLLIPPHGGHGPIHIDLIYCSNDSRCQVSGRGVPRLSVQLSSGPNTSNRSIIGEDGRWNTDIPIDRSIALRADLLNDKGKPLASSALSPHIFARTSDGLQLRAAAGTWQIDLPANLGGGFYVISDQ